MGSVVAIAASATVVEGCVVAAVVAFIVGVHGVGHAGSGGSGVNGACIVFYLCRKSFEFRI